MLPTFRTIAQAVRESLATRDPFTAALAGAHEAATSPWNGRKPPTEAQARAGNYKMGAVKWQGLPIHIENPAHSFREGTDPDGKTWRNVMKAAYGYFVGTRGADGDGIDVFLGPLPESDVAWVLNQTTAIGAFDEHKVLVGFPDAAAAVDAYRLSYTPGWDRYGPPIRLSLAQLRWWLKYADTTRELTLDLVPPESDAMNTTDSSLSRVLWDSAGNPGSGQTFASILYAIRQHDAADGLLLDPMSMADLTENAEVLALDALVTLAGRLKPKMEALLRIMNAAGGDLQALAVQFSEPLRRFGGVHVAALFELSDGQTITAWFHNPDSTPAKLTPADMLVSWKWVLNKKDITIVVAAESGQDLNLREVARRIMRLAAKNSAAFARANAKRTETMAEIQGLKDTLVERQGVLRDLNAKIEVERVASADRQAAKATPLWRSSRFDPTTPEGWWAIKDNEEALLYWQDKLDALFQERIVAVRNALRDLGWTGDRGEPLTFNGATLGMKLSQVGAGRNVVGVKWFVTGNTKPTALRNGTSDLDVLLDNLEATPAELAAELHAEVALPTVVEPVQQAAEPTPPVAENPVYELTAIQAEGFAIGKAARESGAESYLPEDSDAFMTALGKYIGLDPVQGWLREGFSDGWDAGQAPAPIVPTEEAAAPVVEEPAPADNTPAVTDSKAVGDALVAAGWVESESGRWERGSWSVYTGTGSRGGYVSVDTNETSPATTMGQVDFAGKTPAEVAVAVEAIIAADAAEVEASALEATDENIDMLAQAGAEVHRVSVNLSMPKEEREAIHKGSLIAPDGRRIILQTEADVDRAATAVNEAESWRYTPFDASTLKMPTATQLQLQKVKKLILFKAPDGTFAPGWSEGGMMDVEQTPKLVEDALKKYYNGNRESDTLRITPTAARDIIMDRAKTAKVDVKPVSAVEVTSRTYNAKNAIKRGSNYEVSKTGGLVLANVDEGLALTVDQRFFAYFYKTYRGADFYAKADGSLVLVKHNGKVVGVIMPIRSDDSKMLARALRAGSTSNAAAESPVEDPAEADLGADAESQAALAKVEAVYTFGNATAAFKLWMAESVDKPDYSPFVSAKEMDQRAKAHGFTIEWDFHGGATMDGVREPELFDAGAELVFDDAGDTQVLDGIDADGYVGKIMKDGQVVGRIDMGDDGKAMVFMGAAGDERVTGTEGRPFMYSDDDCGEMIDRLAAMLAAPAEPEAPTIEPEPPAPSAEELAAQRDARKAVGMTILQQLGGNKFKAMTGAKDIMALSEGLGGLRFSLPTGFSQINGKSTGINRVFIRLNGSDTYDVEFGGARGTSYIVRATTEDIYAENLREVFTRYTGLETSMGNLSAGLSQKGPNAREARDLYDELSWAITDLQGHSDMELARAGSTDRIERAVEAARQAVVRGWPSGMLQIDNLIEKAEGLIDRANDMRREGGITEISAGDLKSFYLQGSTLTEEQKASILANPSRVMRSGAIDVPRFNKAAVEAAVAAAEAANAAPAAEPAVTLGPDDVSVYVTPKSGEEAMRIRRLKQRDGRTTYSFIGTYGAASGKSFEDMLAEVKLHPKMKLAAGIEFSEEPSTPAGPSEPTGTPYDNLLASIMQTADLTREQAEAAIEALKKAKVLKFDPVNGSTLLQHGAFMERDVLRRAAGLEEPAAPVADPVAVAEPPAAAPVEPPAPPATDPAADQQTADDMALLRTIANGLHPDMLEPELADQIEAAMLRHPDDAAMQELGERAILAFSNGAVAATN